MTAMAENDRTNVDSTDCLEAATGLQNLADELGSASEREEDEADIHVCKKCNIIFYDIRLYLEHKVNHDNFRVTYQRSVGDKRMIIPKLVRKDVKKEVSLCHGNNEHDKSNNEEGQAEEKENKTTKINRGRRGKRKYPEVNEELVIKEMPTYVCEKCNRKFNREATLRRHMEYDHDREEDEDEVEDDEDEDYKPSREEMESAAQELVEESLNPERRKHNPEDQAFRPYTCQTCGHRFKEITVLKTHMLTHTDRREFVCKIDGCTYAFKTKGSLKRHMRRHTGERPYSCEMCGRSFAESGALTRHMRSRIPCTRKTDSDLPRYKKKWNYVPNIPAAIGVIAKQVAVKDHGEQNEGSELIHGAEDEKSRGSFEVISGDGELATEVEGEIESKRVEVLVTNSADNINAIVTEDALDEFIQTETVIDGDAPTKCKVCNEEFLTIEALKVHLRTHLADTTIRCWLCHFITEDKEQIADHMITHHHMQLKDTDEFPGIPKPLINNTDSQKNKEQNFENEAQIAIKQLIEIPTDETAEGEEETHSTQGSSAKCPVCMKRFRGSNYLRLHMRTHTGVKPHKCPHCDKTFISKDTLAKHLSVHVDDRNYKCGECGKLFKRLSHVREHIKIHSSTRPFNCTVCQKTFKNSSAMKVHLRTHTSIQPYECTHCHRRFREKGSLIRHVRMHTGEKPYRCGHCGRSFAEHGTLNRHLKAKVPCSSNLQQEREKAVIAAHNTSLVTDYPTVLAEFSSVVADTQQYIIPEGEDEVHPMPEEETQQAAEYVVVQTEMGVENIQNVQIIGTSEADSSLLHELQVSSDYVMVQEGQGVGMKIIDSRTGETIALVPADEIGAQNSMPVTMITDDNDIEAIAMAPDSDMNEVLQQTLLVTNPDTQVEITTEIQESEIITENA
ncbi:hypothetical protein CHS0354_039462 [Potamilus streckersoni]|uniref:Transcription factor E4F1 n=1 Tax=Potamilus streckersoni TaxID=2493646 RepID=A0AAE0VNY2_9BIVA|nr:hypothetical protein CHS0354_039462 [Potamilus streckersoni]